MCKPNNIPKSVPGSLHRKATHLLAHGKSSQSLGIAKKSVFVLATAMAILSGLLVVIKKSIRIDTDDPSACIFIPGGGHSGSYFKLGQLGKILDAHNEGGDDGDDDDDGILSLENSKEQIYCSSAGCYSAVLALAGTGVDMQSFLSFSDAVLSRIKTEFNETVIANGVNKVFYIPLMNQISTNVVVDYIVQKVEQMGKKRRQKLFSKVNFVTTTLSGGMRSRKAANTTELEQLLRATGLIPFLTHHHWYLQDSDGVRHVDGDFLSRAFPPRCDRVLSQPTFSWSLLRNVLYPVSTGIYSRVFGSTVMIRVRRGVTARR